MNLVNLIKNDVRFKIGFILIIIIIFFSMLSFFSPIDPFSTYYAPVNRPPSRDYLFGTNSKGQDLFWMTSYAFRNSIIFGLITASISRIIALFVGTVSGYRGGRTDNILMIINDSFITLPILLVMILIAMVFRRLPFFLLAVVLGLFGWPWDARLFRSQILSLRERKLTYTARFSGMKTLNIISKIYFPHLTPVFFSTFINNMIWSLGLEVTLSVLGLTSLQTPTIGTTIYWANQHQALIMGIWWWLAVPIIGAIILFTSLYLLTISVNEYVDPRMRVQGGNY
ncbi:ABC transporter permease [Petrotoga halophila]|uniref:Peptide ABC transporter n=1 Tax=Petrotoga halophila DSM 16923 TaxID=1122953 RepID=A0A2S5EJR8_9BACT|nr:ABC transporter permease [Petrotoga halophila]POZ93386.1 peptide ABC transporter [Petrotoga halophila DSM 16923]